MRSEPVTDTSADVIAGPARAAAGTADEVAAAEVIAELYRRDPSTRTFGIELVEGSTGRAVVAMVVRADMCNGYDVCHGGMMFTLADTAMAFASGSHNHGALAAAASIDFLHPVPNGSRVRATAEERWLKGRSGLYDVRVELDDGTLVAVFRGRTVRAGGAVVRRGGSDPTGEETDLDPPDLDTRGGA